ncbi:DUF5131 family protein [Amycolatopsis methanolica]|uniref:Phage Gp37Gp68 family protein n=1 Tax=Amycolatopsis methanolica 239 TaxID=1068978 RepID=A0A076N0B7_AMYME|nr:phage Gp37/Gp68 family protein [Amycolatopsis methanolica]AIJ24566.1 phage Gp37Gp68 family protein [Amycolatopsis methanolica 239]
MRDGTIETATWNPATGCDRVSPGCDNCYAMTFARRLQAMGSPAYTRDGDPRTSGPGFALTLHPGRLAVPSRWRAPRLVFTGSMTDLFHPRVPEDFLADVLDAMARAPQHTYFALTKRPARMAAVLARLAPEPLPHVWWGVTIESNDQAGRADRLRETPAAVRFLSLQPLLGPLPDLDLTGLDWVYAGGESGPHARPMAAEWVRPVRDRCVAAGIPFLFKQWGGRTRNAGGRLLDGRTWDEMPGGWTPGGRRARVSP